MVERGGSVDENIIQKKNRGVSVLMGAKMRIVTNKKL